MIKIEHMQSGDSSNHASTPYIKSDYVICILESVSEHNDDILTFLSLGHNVVLVTESEKTAIAANAGQFPKAGKKEAMFRAAVETGRLSASHSNHLANLQAHAIVIPAGHPADIKTNAPSESLRQHILSVGRELYHSSTFISLIVRHVLQPKEMEQWVIPLLESTSGKSCGEHFGVIHLPHTIDLWDTALQSQKVAYGASDDVTSEIFKIFFNPLAPLLERHDMHSMEAAGFIQAQWLAEQKAFARKMAAYTFPNVFRTHDIFAVLGEKHSLSAPIIQDAFREQTRTLDKLMSAIFESGAKNITFLGAGFIADATHPKVMLAHKFFDDLKRQGFHVKAIDQHCAADSNSANGIHISDSCNHWDLCNAEDHTATLNATDLVLLVNDPDGLNELADQLSEDVSLLDMSLFFPDV